MQRRHLKALTALAAILVAAAGVGSWVVGTSLLAPARIPVQMPESYRGTEVQFLSKSGATLHGNFLQGTNENGVVILMHGIRGNREAMVGHAELLRRNGFSVLLFDFQAHGESEGERITSGYLESMDASAAVDFARQRAPGERIGILGVSLGGAAALLADPQIEVDSMILEMVYADIDRAVKNRIEIVLGKWARPFSPLLTWQLKWRVGKETNWFSPERAIRNVRCPKLIIGGALDQHTHLADTEALYAAAADPKEWWLVKNAGHENIYALVGEEYERRVIDFYRRTLGTRK